MKAFMVIAFLVTFVIVFHRCVNRNSIAKNATYTGSDKCQSCHKKEFDLFKTSDHFHAMDTVSTATVKGNFNNSSFIYSNDTAFFYKKNNQYFVKTTDSTGTKKEFLISYTFGWHPLQQYLIKFDDGRLQVLPFCWDTREKDKGGQRWFHLYNKEKISHTDELFWMGISQNWNYMCADCHTTDYQNKFQLSENKFLSTWKESRVSCESCHGPASEHLQWTKSKDGSVKMKGFGISLSAKQQNWKMDLTKQTMMPETVIKNDTLLETCARCHARATKFTDEYVHGQPFLQSHIPATVNSVNYHIDGQIKEENYEYASFLQSKMYAKGVTCINCHEPHSMKIKATGNNLCTSCHSSAKYDGPQHSYHQLEGNGNKCVNCHMPTTNYMVVDARLDHSIRIPRPDQSLIMGTPNACNKCHTDKSVKWAAENFIKKFGAKLSPEKSYGELLYKISHYTSASEPSLYQILTNKQYPAIIRATAIEQYSYYTSERVKTVVADELQSTDANMRLNAIKAANAYPQEFVLQNLLPLLYDPVLSVRMEAMSAIAPYYSNVGEKDNKQFSKVMNEYIIVQEKMSHRPEGFYNRAIIKKFAGSTTDAEQLYLTCIQRFPDFIQSYSNLVDLYREQNRDDEAKKIIDKGLLKQPGNPFLHYALGLWFIREKEQTKGIAELKKAAEKGSSSAQIIYGYAIGLFSTNQQSKALQLLEQFIAKHGHQLLILDGLISICQDMRLEEKAEKYSLLRKDIYGY